MITRSTATDTVVVDPVSGLLRLCAWCVPVDRRIELHRLHRCSDGMCADCQLQFLAAYPADQPCQLEVTYPTGRQETLSFATAFVRGLYVIALAAQPVTVRLLSVVLLVLAIAAPARAQQPPSATIRERVGAAAYGSLFAADAATTHVALSHYGARELFLTQHPMANDAILAGQAAALWVVTRKLQNPVLRWSVRFGVAGLHGYAAAHNAQAMARARKGGGR